ncbi:MAG: right-handed parallel beta-helix repeat-containing protein [Bacteroidales bacterium]|nr:right-handed parallel beta-helix repeat-containing protein [Bacteroidales bacterium]
MKSPRFLFLTLFVCVGMVQANGTVISINDQASFDRMETTLKEALKGPDAVIEIRIGGGTYYFGEEHISLKGYQYPDKTIRISGSGTRIVAKGRNFKVTGRKKNRFAVAEETFDWNNMYLDSKFRPVQFAPDGFKRAATEVSVLDSGTKLCKLSLNEELNPSVAGSGYIAITQWYRCGVYRIVKVEGKDVFFVADDLKVSSYSYSVNWDWNYGKSLPRYRLINCGSKVSVWDGRLTYPKKGIIHRCDATVFLSVKDSSLGGLYVSGLEFAGNADNRSQWDRDAIILLFRSRLGPCAVADCTFKNIKSSCIDIYRVDNVKVSGCIFSDCYRSCVTSDEYCSDTQVCSNLIQNSGLCMNNVSAIECRGSNFLIRDNRIVDFGYCAIRAGLHYTAEKQGDVTGEISRNEVYQTSSYYMSAPMNLLMDSGAIYITTQSDGIVIRDNSIHDINGPAQNRAIFLDDGACNVSVFGNKIRRTANSYSIDSRRVASIETHPSSKIRTVNVGNRIHDNDVDGEIRFETREGK